MHLNFSVLIFSCFFCTVAKADNLPTYNMPQSFIKAVRADDWIETSTKQTTPTIEFSQAYSGIFGIPKSVMKQPSGALSGKIVFLLSGHGWTYNGEQQKWYTQRGLTHGLVEDMGNQDQATIFADYLWNSGATIVPLRPIGFQPEERIICSNSLRAKYYGSWFDSDSPIRFNGYPEANGAKFAKTSLSESALARFTPFIAVPGLYPVYVWNRDGADRTIQTYRIRHSEGMTEIRINHRMVGKGWIYLGTFPFETGESSCLEITNKVVEPYDVDNGRVVLAEAVRFGNGRSNVNLGGGITDDTRETEGSNFWLKDSLGAGTDGDFIGEKTVSDPPKMSAHMNRENEGSYFDRIYWSFHSNASGSPTAKARGAVALWNKDVGSRTDFQESLASVTGRTFADDLGNALSKHPLGWIKRPDSTANYINFGELRRDYFQNEMPSVLMENAFHDNQLDASLLLEPEVRIEMARASLHGIVNWLQQTDPRSRHLSLIPKTPERLAAMTTPEGQLRVTWDFPANGTCTIDQPDSVEVSLLHENTTHIFSVPANQKQLYLDGFSTSSLCELTVCVQAVNAGGKSIPSGRLAVSPGMRANILLVDAFLTTPRETNRKENTGSFLGGVFNDVAQYERIYLPKNNPKTTVLGTADSLTSLGLSVACAQITALDTIDLNQFSTVIVLTGNIPSSSTIFTSPAINQIRSFSRKGGNLIFAGAHAPSLLPSSLLTELFNASVATTSTLTGNVITTQNSGLANVSPVKIKEQLSNNVYLSTTMDTIFPGKNNTVLAVHENTDQAVAIASKLNNGSFNLLLSFGPEQIPDRETRYDFVRELLPHLEHYPKLPFSNTVDWEAIHLKTSLQ